MSAKRPAAPLDQAAVKRSRVQEDAVAHESSRHAATNQPSKTAHSARAAPPSSNSAAHVGARGVAREQSAHSQAGSHAAGALNMSAAQRAPRAAHSGSPAAAPRSGYTNVVGASPKSSSGAGLSFGSLKQSSGQSQSQSQSSTAALASLLPLLYGTGSGERNLEVAAAQLASGALKQTASGQSQSLLSSLTSPLSNMNIASLGTLLNYQMAAAIQKLGAPAVIKKESPGNSHTHAHASASARPSFPKSAANAPPTPPATQKQALASGALNVPLNLTGTNSGATLHHHASQQSHFAGYGTSDAPIDLSKKTSAAAPPKVRSSVPMPPAAAKTRAPEPTRADSAVPVNDVRLERERDHHARSDVTRSGENAPVTRERERDRDRTPQTDKLANGEAERQIPVITLSDDEAESDDDESAALFDEEFAEVERLSAPLTDDPESPVDRAALLAARKRLVRELRRSLMDEEARIELLRRWNSHNAVNAREQPKAGTLNGKAAQTQPAAAAARTPKGTPQLPASAKRELTSRTASAAATPQPAHAHGTAAILNGGPPNVTINQQPAHGGQSSTPGSVPLKVPRVSSSSELTKSATTTPRGPQSALANASANATSARTPATGSAQRATPQLSAAQLQAQLAASKLSLRKQVEKTLGQLAPPKPVAGTDIQFVPSVNYTDLLCLVGLDETVNALQRFETASSSSKNAQALSSNAAVPSNGVVPNDATANDSANANANGLPGPSGAPQPAAESKRSASAASQIRTCIQCETDFTPTWRVAERSLLNAAAQKRLTALRETAPRPTAFHVCERCAVHNLKKSTRSDYLTKLKQTFTQLARDERELEERYTSLIAQAPQSVPNANSATHNSSNSLHATPSGSNRSTSAVQNALKEAQQLLSASGSASNSGRGTSSPTPVSASLANSLSSLGAGSQSFNSASALNAFTAFTAAMNAAANAMKTASPSSNALNLSAANLGNALSASGLNASALASGLNSSPLGVGGALNPASLSAALQAFLSLQNPSFSAGSSRGTSSSAHSTAANTNTSASASSLSAFPSQFGEAARSSAASFGVNSQPSASSGASPVKTANDLHRQYYLEMVTRPPVLPNWKK